MKLTILIFALLFTFTTYSKEPIKKMKLVTGSGNAGFTDGNSAELNKPIRFAAYKENSIIFADINNHAIRIVTIDGKVTTIVGGPDKEGYKDGPAETAKIKSPHGVAYDEKSDKIYIAEAGNHTIRVITKNAQGGFEVSTLAGNPNRVGFMDGQADSAKFVSPHAIVVCSDGGVAVADIGNARIRKIKDGMVSTLAGSGETGNEDGIPDKATFKYVMDIAADGEIIYVADAGSHLIRKIVPGKEVTTLTLKDTLSTPHGIAIDKDKNLYIADMGTHRILKIDKDGNVTTIAGTGESGSKLSELNKPAAVLVHGEYLWIADLYNHQIKVIEIE
ncbi:MAG: SMP-30/gluconolactonase/LRE family protein [Melioribacteraceae bacterium]|nr:SMP-30/gluconolactonase/LRE family protein [Melioribacteraceae bacterium]